MSAIIYRKQGCRNEVVARFDRADDALLCFKAMAYNLNEKLIMVVARGPITVNQPHGCHLNGVGEYVLDPTFHLDNFHR